MSVDAASFVERRFGKATEEPYDLRGVRYFRLARNNESVAVHFSKGYRRLGVRVDVHRAAPDVPLHEADHHVFICTEPPEEILLIIDRKPLAKAIAAGELKKDPGSNKHYVVLQDVPLC